MEFAWACPSGAPLTRVRGLPLAGGDALGPQAWLCHLDAGRVLVPPSAGRFRAPENTDRRPKPEHGTGFWTSPFREGPPPSCEWLDLLEDTGWAADPEYRAARAYVVEPSPAAAVYVVDARDDWIALLRAFPLGGGLVDWRAIADAGIDAVSQTSAAVDGWGGIDTWDCASTAWLRWRIDRVEHHDGLLEHAVQVHESAPAPIFPF